MKPVQLGITGGIGSGKSIVGKVLEELGIPIFHADIEARRLLENDTLVIAAVTRIIGNNAYMPDGRPDRGFIASEVFSNSEKLKELNAVIHPKVQRNYEEWVNSHSDKFIVAKEAAIMFESGSHKGMDFIVAVTAPEEVRIKRVMERDGKPEEAVRKIMNQQLPQSEVVNKSDFEITNNNHRLVVPQVQELVRIIREKSESNQLTI